MHIRQAIQATSHLNEKSTRAVAGLRLALCDSGDRGLVEGRLLSQLALCEAHGPENTDQLSPLLEMMHRSIMPDDASTHQSRRSRPQNAAMHEKTRANIKKLMLDTGINSERQLALDCNMSQSTLNRFLKGATETLEFSHLQTLAHHFGLTVSQLIGETPFVEDRKVRVVALAMQQMPEYKKDMLVAASSALNQPEAGPSQRKASNGG